MFLQSAISSRSVFILTHSYSCSPVRDVRSTSQDHPDVETLRQQVGDMVGACTCLFTCRGVQSTPLSFCMGMHCFTLGSSLLCLNLLSNSHSKGVASRTMCVVWLHWSCHHSACQDAWLFQHKPSWKLSQHMSDHPVAHACNLVCPPRLSCASSKIRTCRLASITCVHVCGTVSC